MNYDLTPRQQEIYSLVVKGFRNKDIAKKLFICEASVKFHTGRIFKIMRVKSRYELILKEVRRGVDGLDA